MSPTNSAFIYMKQNLLEAQGDMIAQIKEIWPLASNSSSLGNVPSSNSMDAL
jgi:hypothetical protein